MRSTYEAGDPDFERRVRDSFAQQAFMATLDAEIVTLMPGRCDIRAPRSPALVQQDGFLHAGVLASIADSAAGYAAFTLMDATDSVLSLEFKINLLRPASGDAAVARARVIKPGRVITPCAAEIFAEVDGAEFLCAIAQLTMIRVPKERGRPAGGDLSGTSNRVS